MLAAERQSVILQRSLSEGAVRTTGLAKDFGVTEETVRRDLEKLSQAGKLLRIHGGATTSDFAHRDFAHIDREIQQQAEKRAIACCAVRLIQPQETIFLDASSSAFQLAAALPETLPIRVVTYSLPVIEQLQSHSEIELLSLGGSYERAGRRFGGLLVAQNLANFRIDRFFLSGKGLDPQRGVSEANEEQSRLKQFALRHAGWSGLLLDHTKLSVASTYFFAQLNQLAAVISDQASAPYFDQHSLPDSCKLHLAPDLT